MKKYEVIYNTYRESILSGILKYGDRVDSIRECVKKMNVSKTTVELAYNKLVLDGFISSKEKVGYVVSMNTERVLLHHEILDYSSSHKEKEYDYDFRIQSVSIDSFETSIWKRYIKDVLNDKKLMSSYGLAQGEYGLRQALCKYVYQNRNILCFPEQMVIGSNYQSLLYIFCGMLDKQKVIGLSTLVDEQAKQVFLSYGFSVKYLDPDHFIEDIQDKCVDVVYVNTTCFSKNRQSMSEKLRKELVSLENILILEDDYNGELVYASKIKTSLCSMSNHVIYFGLTDTLVTS
ncbi:GntR family transcriptional regulator [Holdemanella biformis]|uniref:GntR family transcriptional regulator n=1 Tax=Holdemanella biformis TaxID=1735 RepID=UPI003AB887A9